MIVDAIKKLINKNDLTNEMTYQVFLDIMDGKCTEAQIASFLTALTMKGETINEITSGASVLREKSLKITCDDDIIDIVGTGGDMANTFNISTLSSIVASAAGAKVAKHGNRSASSNCGSADVLEALGVKLDLAPSQSQELLNDIDICFMYARVYHQSMKHVAKPRKEMKIRTIFNILGPLSNPANTNIQLLGVYDKELVNPLANVLYNLGVKRAMVVHGFDNLDEVTLTNKTYVSEIKNGEVIDYIFDPKKYGFEYCNIEDLKGKDVEYNKEIIYEILNGKKSPKRDITILNSGLALYLYFENLTKEQAFRLAEETIDSKKALYKLEQLIKKSNEV